MLEDAMNYQLINQKCLIFVHMSKYGDQTHGENLDCVSLLKIVQTGYLLSDPRIFDQYCPVFHNLYIIKHGYHATMCMSCCKPNHGLKLWFSL